MRGSTLARLTIVSVLLSIGNTPALRVIRAGTRLTVHRSLPIELGQNRAARAGARDHENIVFDEETIEKSSRESKNKFKLCNEALDRANKIEKS